MISNRNLLASSRNAATTSAAHNLGRVAIAIAFGFTLLAPRAADACQACAADTDCPRGFACDAFGKYCSDTNCTTDDDCAGGMRCVTGTSTECDGDRKNCHELNSCAPIWQAGCTHDADCGEGYECGSPGTLCTSNSCVSIGACHQKGDDKACATDADCPACWSCTTDPGQACINDGGPVGGIPAPVPGPRACRPPYWGLTYGYEGVGPAPGSAPPAPACAAAATPTAIDSRVANPETPTTPGSTGLAATGTGSNANAEANTAGSVGGGGCAVGGADASGSWAWLMGLGTVVLSLGGRKRRTAVSSRG